MTTQMNCPACHALLKLAKAIAPGKLIRCPKCTKTVRVPEETDVKLKPAPPAKKSSAVKKPTRPPVVDEDDEELEEAPAPPAKKSPGKKPIRNRDDEEEVEARRPRKSRKDKMARDAEGNSGLVRNLIGAGVLLVLLVVLAVVFISRWSEIFPKAPAKEAEPLAKKPTSKKPTPNKPAPNKPAPAGNNPGFQEMANRLAGSWVGELPQGGAVIYHYRDDGSFTLKVQKPGNPLTINGTWSVVGIGADSLSILRKGADPASEFFASGDRPTIYFPAPNLMLHTFQNTGLQFAREGSGLKPGQLPPPNERQQAVVTLKAMGADVLQGAGFDGRVHQVRFQKNATDGDLVLLKPLSGITAVGLTGCTKVTDAGLVHLTGLTKLQSLAINGTQVTDTGLAQVKGLKELVGFECGGPNIHGQGLVHLQELPKLQSLHLNKGAITDAGMAHVGKLTRLTFVDLDDTRITDTGLAHLHGCAKLRVVRLRRTQVTEAGVQALKKAVPNVQVEQ